VRPTRAIDADEQRLEFGALVSVSRDGEPFATLTPSRNYYSGRGMGSTGPVRGFFEGEATSEVGRREGAGGDLWAAMQPDLQALDPVIERGDERLAAFAERLPMDEPEAQAALATLQGQVIRAVSDRYLADPPAANFRVNVNPLVIWIWVGGAIAVVGAVVAVWPAPAARRRRVSDVYAARLARELGRA
jgi:cytochrome c-type biogenesis protein CcmF